MHYVIIGNSIAALNAIAGIREVDQEGQITVISREPRLAYGRPLISYWLEERSHSDLSYRPKAFYECHDVELLLGKEAVQIEPGVKMVYCRDGEAVSYDRLLIATGGKPFVPPVTGLNQVSYHTLLDLDDARKLKDVVSPGDEVLIIGGGLVGLKAAECLHRFGLSVQVIELAGQVLSSILSPDAAEIVQKHLEEAGVNLNLGKTVEKVVKDGARIAAKLTDGSRLDIDHLVFAIGVSPNADLARQAGAEVGRGVRVNPETMLTTLPQVYAAGDVVEMPEPLSETVRVTATLPNAALQGRRAGRAMAGADTAGELPAVLFNSLGVLGTQIFTVGLTSSQDTKNLRTITPQRAGDGFRQFFLDENRLRGAILIDDVISPGLLQGIIYNELPVDPELLARGDFDLIDLPEDYWQQCLAVQVG